MKACINTLLSTIVRIMNLSFTEACVREILKLSAVEPRIKNPMLDNELRSSYRPISSLRFISKAIEKVAADRLNCHLTENDLHVPLLLAYKPSHGTETALLKVQDVIVRSLDKNNCVILLLLDMSAAFDTVEYKTSSPFWNQRKSTGMVFVLYREQKSVCTCWEWVLDLFVSSSLWGSPRIRTWSSPLFTIHCTSEWCPQTSWYVVSFVCRWQPDIHVLSAFTSLWDWILQI